MGKVATFMPKPLYGDNGSGMHTHQSLWSDGKPLFYDEAGYGQLSDIARWYIGGTPGARARAARLHQPDADSYHRLVKGFEAPVNLVYSAGNRSAAIRIPITGSNPKAKRIEFVRPTRPATRTSPSPHSSWPASTASRTASSRTSRSTRTSTSFPRGGKDIPQVPNSLLDSLDALAADHQFLLEGGVFTKELIETWISYKYENEILPMAQRPHPFEYELYFGV